MTCSGIIFDSEQMYGNLGGEYDFRVVDKSVA